MARFGGIPIGGATAKKPRFSGTPLPVSRIAADLGLKGNQVSSNIEMARPLDNRQKYEAALKTVADRYFGGTPVTELMKAPGFSPTDAGGLFNGGLMFGLGDEARGASGALAALLTGKNAGQAFQDFMALEQARRDYGRETSGPLGAVAEFGGAMLAGGPTAVSQAATGKVLPAAINAGTQGALFGFANTDGNLHDRAGGGLLGAGIGFGLGAAVQKGANVIGEKLTAAAQRKATNAAIKNAPASADLAAASRAMFQAVDDSGVTVKTPAYAKWLSDIVGKAKSMRISPDLDPKATGAFKVMIEALSDLEQNGGTLAVSDLHTLRQIAQKAAMSTEGRDATFANMIVDGLDNFITSPGNLNVGGKEAGNTLMAAISTWGRARRVGLIETAIETARNAASGFENGLRVEFRKLLKPQVVKMFTPAERQAIEEVVRGNPVSNLAKLAGMFGFNLGAGSKNVVGGSIGLAMGGPIGVAAGMVGRRMSEKLTENAATRAAQVVATPNIPQVAPKALPPGLQQLLLQSVRGTQPFISP